MTILDIESAKAEAAAAKAAYEAAKANAKAARDSAAFAAKQAKWALQDAKAAERDNGQPNLIARFVLDNPDFLTGYYKSDSARGKAVRDAMRATMTSAELLAEPTLFDQCHSGRALVPFAALFVRELLAAGGSLPLSADERHAADKAALDGSDEIASWDNVIALPSPEKAAKGKAAA